MAGVLGLQGEIGDGLQVLGQVEHALRRVIVGVSR